MFAIMVIGGTATFLLSHWLLSAHVLLAFTDCHNSLTFYRNLSRSCLLPLTRTHVHGTFVSYEENKVL